MKKHYITNEIAVRELTVVVAGNNGKQADARIDLCFGEVIQGAGMGTWVGYLRTNGGDELIHDANLAEIDSVFGIDTIIEAAISSDNSGIVDFGEWLADEWAKQQEVEE